MKLEQFFAKPSSGKAAKGARGVESGWLSWCELQQRGPVFLIVDAGFAPS